MTRLITINRETDDSSRGDCVSSVTLAFVALPPLTSNFVAREAALANSPYTTLFNDLFHITNGPSLA